MCCNYHFYEQKHEKFMKDQPGFTHSNNSQRRQTGALLLAGLFTALTAVGAFIRIPMGPVPFTLQILFVLLAGNLLSPRYALLSQAAYLSIGLAGLPIFSHGGGPVYVLEPSFGYILAFPFAAVLISRFSRVIFSHRNGPASFWPLVLRLAAVNLLGILLILALGVVYLYYNLNFVLRQPIAFGSAVTIGLVLFLPMDVLKAIVAAMIAVKIQNQLKTGNFK